jgi:DNA-binding transcriptional LysR family regulator
MVKLDDMRVFSKLAEVGSLTAAARELAMPKQSVSRRLAELESALGVQLAVRTTRKLRLTDVGRAYALRCAEVARLAEEANRAALDELDTPHSTLRITADHTFGEAFLPELANDYLQRYPEVRLDVVLTSRVVDLVEEGFDVAFRVGRLPDSTLVARRLGPARLIACAAPSYLERRGAPRTPDDLAEHDCIDLAPGEGPSRWPFAGPDGVMTIAVNGRIRVSSLPMARGSAVAGIGIACIPAFACADDLRTGRLVQVLGAFALDVGGVYLVYPHHRHLAARVRRFVDLAASRFGGRNAV